jgi:pimeloyl-ACP methyl ester carboxylesterase
MSGPGRRCRLLRAPFRPLALALTLLGAAAHAHTASTAHTASATHTTSATHATSASPARVHLRQFDALRRTVVLPDGIRLAYVSMGNPRGVPVVLIHGYTDSGLDWAPLVPYLSRDLRLIIVDLRGHGASSKPECCYTRYDFAYDIELLLEALRVRRADIVGHSLGSLVAQTFAELWPQRTARVVLISSTASAPPRRPGKPQYDWAAQISRLKEPIDPDSRFMREWWASPTPVDRRFLRRERRNAAAIPLRVWLAVLDEGLGDLDDLARTLPQLRAPTLLLWGSADPIMLPPMRRSLERALPHAKVVIFPGLGHNPFWEDPRGCAAVIDAFLDPATSVRRYGAGG